MKIDLLSLEPEDIVGGLSGQKILIYGPNDTGKTKQASKFEKPLILATEAGSNAVRATKVTITRWSEFTDVVKQLTNEKTYELMFEKYKTIVVDTAENLVTLAENAINMEFGTRDLGEIQQLEKGNPNGYVLARRSFSQEVNKLALYGYCVVFIGHEEEIEKLEELTGEMVLQKVPKYSNKEKSSMRWLRDLCDFVIYTKPRGIDPDTGETIPSIAICKETANVFARSRYSIQTFVDPFSAKNIQEAIEKAIRKTAKEEDSNISYFERKEEGYTLDELKAMIAPYISQLWRIDEATRNACVAIIEQVLGEGRKVGSAKEGEEYSLEIIYNKLVALADNKGVNIELPDRDEEEISSPKKTKTTKKASSKNKEIDEEEHTAAEDVQLAAKTVKDSEEAEEDEEEYTEDDFEDLIGDIKAIAVACAEENITPKYTKLVEKHLGKGNLVKNATMDDMHALVKLYEDLNKMSIKEGLLID